mmetsp:Transcript_30830/g.47246  ORF Transcript_30830/g.47246 Transcript_30830/m.47246 type:complete len:114 (+) Transcript_30830:684-1025(+)
MHQIFSNFGKRFRIFIMLNPDLFSSSCKNARSYCISSMKLQCLSNMKGSSRSRPKMETNRITTHIPLKIGNFCKFNFPRLCALLFHFAESLVAKVISQCSHSRVFQISRFRHV